MTNEPNKNRYEKFQDLNLKGGQSSSLETYWDKEKEGENKLVLI